MKMSILVLLSYNIKIIEYFFKKKNSYKYINYTYSINIVYSNNDVVILNGSL